MSKIVAVKRKDDKGRILLTKEEKLNELILLETLDRNKISDGYHTFGELYAHRIALFAALCHALKDKQEVWKSKKHSDGSVVEGYFIAGIGLAWGKQITYHIPIAFWEDFEVEAKVLAPKYDRHTQADVIDRLLKL